MSAARRIRAAGRRGGFALVIVIVVLGLLLVLCAPFLLTAHQSDRSSSEIYDRAQARVALESASVHAMAQLGRSHLALDGTPYFDDLDEVVVSNRFDEKFLDPNDARGVMWDLEVSDVAGRVDLDSAPPVLFANLMGAATRFTKPVSKDDAELQVASVAGLDPTGVIWVEGEFIRYGAIEENRLIDLVRGLGAREDADGNPLPGPRPPREHGVGAVVLDQRALAPVIWRMFDGGVRGFGSFEELREADEFALAATGLGPEALRRIGELGTVYADAKAGPLWQRPVRITSELERDVDDHFQVDDPHWFNEGSTVQITDGRVRETALVVGVSASGTIYLDRAVSSGYDAYTAVARVLARRPVNANTAPPEVLRSLFDGLKLRGRNERVTGSEARDLAQLVVESRPFLGFEDFLRRIVLPAAGLEELPKDAPVVPDVFARGGTLIDEADALAIYANALNANDYALEVSTAPLSFTSRDVYRLDLRAAVNAPSGVERYSLVRDDVRLVAPQQELLHLWARQEDFDAELRLGRDAPWWMSGPMATSPGAERVCTPPPRLWPNFGTVDGASYLPGVLPPPPLAGDTAPTAEHVFASREDDGYAQLWPARDFEIGQRQGHMLHFDLETRHPEGRYLPDETISLPTDDALVEWTAGTGLMRACTFSLWIQPRSLADAVLLDVGGTSTDADRLSLLLEGGDLVLRVLDGGGDHRDTVQREAAELRYALAPGDGPGLPADVWSHVFIDVRGARPSLMTMLVNGTAHGVRAPGLARLATSVTDNTAILPLDQAEGFPDRGVVRIGDELVEYRLSGGALDATFVETGQDAGFGGRNARVRWSAGPSATPQNLGTLDMNHPAGTAVELYGYSLELSSDVPQGEAALPGALGSFRCGRVVGVEGGSSSRGDMVVVPVGLGAITGIGIEGAGSSATGLVLAPADDASLDPAQAQLMEAFNPSGGYAAMVQIRWGGEGTPNEDLTTQQGSRVAGIEVFRYSGVSGNVLNIAARGNQVSELKNLQGVDVTDTGGARAFIYDWQSTVELNTGNLVTNSLDSHTFVFPISLGVTSGASFLQPQAAGQGAALVPEFAQIVREGTAEQTEWVAYDEVVGNQLVRDSLFALEEAYLALTNGRVFDLDDSTETGPGGGPTGGTGGPPTGGTGGPGGGGQTQLGAALPGAPDPLAPLVPGAAPGASSSNVTAPGAPSPAPSAGIAARAAIGPIWEPVLGEPDDLDYPLTRALRERFLFRGVLATHSTAHPSGTRVTPVFRTIDAGPDGGAPGRFDPVFVMGSDFTHLGWPLAVHRGHLRSLSVPYHPWLQADPNTPVAAPSGTEFMIDNVGFLGERYVALTTGCPQAMVAGSVGGSTGQFVIEDTRALTRLMLFPSGERPRDVSVASVGAGFQQGAGAIVSAVADEVWFGHPEFGLGTIPGADPETMQGAPVELAEDFAEQGPLLEVYERAVRIPHQLRGSVVEVLSDWNQNAGLVKAGDEILAYDAVDANQGTLRIAVDGWGLLGTQPQPHARGETLVYLEGLTVGILAGDVGAGSAALPLTDASDFPEQGTVLVGDELIHYTRRRGNVLEMPASSTQPGAMDARGDGLFRGRYGTEPAGHSGGEPVILFPFRYWDRWSERADAPELGYFGFTLEEPGAWWRSTFWTDEEAPFGGVALRALVRAHPDVPWDADPELEERLWRLEQGLREGAPIELGVQADRLEWRVFAQYEPGAFDPLTASSHAWRTTPLLRRIGAFYLAPGATLRSVER